MLAGPTVLAGLGILIGLVPPLFDRGIGVAAASAVAGRPLVMKLKLWSGVDLESLVSLGVSVLGFAAGFALYRRLHLVWRLPHLPRPLQAVTPASLYDRGLAGVLALAAWHTRVVQGGRLRVYVTVVVLAAVAAALPRPRPGRRPPGSGRLATA